MVDSIQLPPLEIPLPSGSMETKKHKKSKHHDSDGDDNDHAKKKHKKSKKKDKHKDKQRDRDERKEKKKNKTDEPELSAIEKFNMFKKQREASKGEDKVVDDLFRDFITSKLKEIESDNAMSEKGKSGKSKHENSMDELNKFLDNELSSISLPSVASSKEKETHRSDNFHTSKAEAAEKLKLDTNSTNVSVLDNPTKLGSLLKSNKKKTEQSQNIVSVEKQVDKTEIPLRKEKESAKTSPTVTESPITLPSEPKTGSSPPDVSSLSKNDTTDAKDTSGKPASVFGPMLPRSVVVGEKKETTADVKAEVKKPLGFKNFGIKLSASSAELIQSGELHKKGKRLEEGEVLTSSSGNSDSSEVEVEGDDDENDDIGVSETGSISDSGGETKSGSKTKKKKKKGKHKKKKKAKDKEKDDVLVVGNEKSSSKRKVSVTSRSRSRSPKKSRRTRSHSRDRSRRRSRSYSRGRSKKSRSRSRGRGRSHRSRSGSRGRRSRSKSSKRTRSRDRRSKSRGHRSRSHSRRTRSRSRSLDRFWHSRYGDFDAYKFLKGKRGRSRSRSRSPDRESERFIEKEKKRLQDLRLKIDKAKLREIAIQNALSNARSGGPKLDIAIKSGGKSVEELTEYCKKIQEREQEKKKYRNEFESSSEEEGGKNSDDEDFHHPFEVKEAGSIVLDIKNAKPLPIVTPQERLVQSAQLRITYPVSSGSQHRDKEWVPVEPEPTPSVQTPKSNTVGVVPALMPPPPAPPKPKPEVKVFEEPPETPGDISSIVSERLAAMKKLQENPNDVAAKIVFSKAQKQASQWAQSKNLPGQFIGSTGASILSQEELMGDKKRQAWLKKDVFTSAAPVTGGIGMFLLQKMGWKQGEGLGKNNEGTREPLLLDFKVDRKGLNTQGEGKKGPQPKGPSIKDLSGKHPVSALGELCNKRKWGAPQYEVVHESGPAHKKDFLFKVRVNSVDYQPSVTSNNKKLAKAQAATVCLQELGLIPRNTT